MTSANRLPLDQLSCTAFDHSQRVASGTYFQVALALKEHARRQAEASVLIFDNATGKQIDFDLRGTDIEISSRLATQFPGSVVDPARSAGRPKLGVVAREVTLLPRHWEWLAEQSGGTSAALRKLVEDALHVAPSEKMKLRKLQERAFYFMSAIAGNLPHFEEASRALFANNMLGLRDLVSDWPSDVRDHLVQLCFDETTLNHSK